jgi:hypothetical protein
MNATGTTGSGSVWFSARRHWPPDDASSRARLNRDETTESPPRADIRPREEKARGGAIRAGLPGSSCWEMMIATDFDGASVFHPTAGTREKGFNLGGDAAPPYRPSTNGVATVFFRGAVLTPRPAVCAALFS